MPNGFGAFLGPPWCPLRLCGRAWGSVAIHIKRCVLRLLGLIWEMESDSTLPATDDFGSRFLEMDEYDEGNYEALSDESPESTTRSILGRRRKKRPVSLKKIPSKRQIITTRKIRPVRQGRRPPARVTDAYTGSSGSDSESIAVPTPVPSSRSRTRLGYQSSQSSLWTLEDVMVSSERTTDQSAISAAVATLTPEQLEIRQRRIERRRESAKNKAEKEMQDTVERLLRVNTEYAGGSGNGGGRGRSRRAAPSAESGADSDDSDGEKKKKNALHPSLPLDPPLGVEGGEDHPLLCHQLAPSPPKPRLCEQCHSAPRRYACARTGRSLCSLKCFKDC
ncbi:hypothetical protein TcWFU_000516 [Taenia crassiceps]|uniref:INO80 complex subunit B-like conserved region domain-containing protein n=1 Tax=Taenia crassiceps TaxID=6207 RepID=A0ABR4Q0K2_9CEST